MEGFKKDNRLGTILALVIIQLAIKIVKTERVFPGNPYSHREILDPEGKFVLEWIADPKSRDIVFNITAETKGYVAIGFSKTGKMLKSDIVIGGVRNNRRTYLSDRYTTAKDRFPKQDSRQSWKLINSWENRTHTSIKIQRLQDTCDPHDLPITEDSIHLIWAYGENDVLDYHFKNRGSFQTHLLQPDLTPEVVGSPSSAQQMILMPSMPPSSSTRAPPPTNETKLDVWRLTTSVKNPVSGNPWCVFQQGPELRKKHNIIGFSTPVTNERVKESLDRLVLYKCSPTEKAKQTPRNSRDVVDSSAKFEQLVDYSGECKNATDLYLYCYQIIYTWGKGGKDVFLPKSMGIPFGIKDEYYLLETYFIPQQTNLNRNQTRSNQSANVTSTSGDDVDDEDEFDIDIDLLLTQSPRPYEAKVMKVGYDPMSTIIIPPGSQDFEVFGHCPNECTSQMIPKRQPMKVFGVSFDTGPKGKAVALHHFRNAFEIPIILENKNHDPKFQQMQILRQETPIRPGDQLTVRCVYGKHGQVNEKPAKVSSTSTPLTPSPRCLAYVWYYQELGNGNGSSASSPPVQNDFECTSKIHPSDLYRWVEENAPQSFKRNIDLPQLLQSKLMKLRWTPFLRLSLYELYEFGRYRASCGPPLPSASQQISRTRNTANNNNNNRSQTSAFNFYRNRNNSSSGSTSSGRTNNRNGKNRAPATRIGASSSYQVRRPSSRTNNTQTEITVQPLPVEEMPYTMECPSLDDDGLGNNGGVGSSSGGPLLFAPLPPGPVIFGYP